MKFLGSFVFLYDFFECLSGAFNVYRILKYKALTDFYSHFDAASQ